MSDALHIEYYKTGNRWEADIGPLEVFLGGYRGCAESFKALADLSAKIHKNLEALELKDLNKLWED